MAQPKTQDNQKVFQSATQNFKSFVGAVDNVSSSKNISEIYDNMTKLFDAFTQGALTGQGANSEILLRTVYRSLSDDFLKIIQDTDAVEKIVELIKSKQESIDPEQVDQALVSETTKKVVTKTLDPYECDPMSVVLDFVDELQTAILQVKLNLSREYERKKLAYAKSYEGQQEDLDRLNQEYTEQDEAMVEVLDQMSEDEETWKEDSLEKLEKLLETFNQIGQAKDSNFGLLKDVDKTLSTDKQIQAFLNEKPTKFSPKKTIDAIKGVGQLKSKPGVSTIESKFQTKTVVKSTQTEVNNTVVVKEQQKKPQQPKKDEKPKVPAKPLAKDDKKTAPAKEKQSETPTPVKKDEAKPVQPQAPEKVAEQMGKKGPTPVQQEPIKVVPPPPFPVVQPEPGKDFKPKKEEVKAKPIVEKPIMEKPIVQKPVIGKPIIEKAVEQKPTVEKPTVLKPEKGKTTAEKPKVEKPVTAKPVVAKPEIEKPVTAKPVIEKPVAQKPVVEKPVAEKPAVEKPVVEKPTEQKPVVNKPIVEKPKVDKPAFERPRNEKPVVEKPVQQKPIVQKPTLQKAKIAQKKVNKPLIQKPLVKKPILQKPVVEKPVLGKPGVGKPIFQKPVTQKPILQKPVLEKPIKKKPLLEKLKVEKASTKIVKRHGKVIPKSPMGKKTPDPKLAQKNFAKDLDKTLNAGKSQEQTYGKKLSEIEKYLTKDEKEERQKTAEEAKRNKEDDSVFKQIQEKEKKIKEEKEKIERAQQEEEKKKQAEKKKPQRPPKGKLVKPIGKKQVPQKPKDTKLKVKPSSGLCACPICGAQHLPGMHSHGMKKKKAVMPLPIPVPMGKSNQSKLSPPLVPTNPLGGSDQSQSGIPQDKIMSALGTIHDNLGKTMNNKKFKNSFMLNYKPIQKGVQKQLGKINSDEITINKDLQETENGIKKLKNKKKGSFLSRLMNGGITGLIFKVIGGLILIALARIALKKWKEAYMPPTDGSTMTIFGFQIPGWDTIKAIGIGIYNFITVGLANHYDRLKLFFGELREKLFGKKGALRSMSQVRHILRRLVLAWIIGQTKKAVRGACDWLLDILAIPLNALAPGAGTILKFLIKLLPEIYSFITTQIMLMWSKNKRDAEEAESAAAEGMEMAVNTGTTTAMSMISSQLKGLSAGVKPYKGQLANIPGLETQRGPKGRGPRKLAIMRRVPIKYHKSFEKAKQMQNKRFESDMEENKKNDEKRINGGGDVLISQIIEDTSKMNQAVDEFTGSIGTWFHSWDEGKVAKIRKYAPKEYEDADNRELADKWKYDKEFKQKVIHNYTSSISQEIYKRTIVVELDKVSKYMDALGKSQRFKNVKGPLYDPVKGWNPGYRVYASDLKTAIPFNPLEKIHSKADIPIGEPARPEGDSIGWMPFKWISNGVPVNVHPINWELARANAIWNLYNWLMKNRFQNNLNNWNTTNIEDFKKAILPDVFADWRSWNYPVGDHRSEGSWGKAYPPETYQYGDQFVRFINAFRAGKIDHGNNNLDTAMKLRDPTYLEKMFDKMHKKLGDYGTGAVAGAAIGGAVMGPVGAVAGAAIGAAAVGVYKGAKWVGQKMDDLQRALSYDQDPDGEEEEQTEEVEEEESSVPLIGWLINGVKKVVKVIKKIVKKVSRKVAALNRIKEWRGKTYFGVNYGDIRDFMIDTGVLQLFSQGQIINPIGKTIPLLDKLIDMKVIGKGSEVEGGNSMHSLMEAFFSYNRIEGYDWKKMSADKTAQAAFAQSLLEYLALKVIPQWNIVEKLLSNDVTKKTDETKKAMDEGVQVLANLLSFKSIMDHLSKYLRFPNMKVKVIDFSNARDDHDRELLEQFRKDQGIPNSSEKNQILSQWQGVWSKIPSMNDEELQGSIDNLKKLIGTAAFEAKYTGEFTYEKQLRKFYTAMIKEKDERLKAQAAGDKIVQKPGGIQRVMEGPPPKTMLEIEEERKQKEAEEARKAAEEEEKRKAEEEKRLQEEAKRQEELKIAQAKIAAMEAIKKQEQNYENILEKMVQDPATVTDEELKSLGNDVKNLKQEAENKIAQLPREEREMKLALIRGDKLSEKTFAELKETAVGLSGSLQTYIQEVNKIPVGSIMAIQNTPGTPTESRIQLQDSDNVDMGDQ